MRNTATAFFSYGGRLLDRSLSIILVVHNAQDCLARRVGEILDVLPELTPQFELLIVDDGSTDATEEVAQDLACRYPQVGVQRHANKKGTAAAAGTGMERTTGEIVFVLDDQSTINADDVRRLWALRDDEDLVLAEPEPRMQPVSAGLVQRLAAWGRSLRKHRMHGDSKDGIRMIRRSTVDELRDNFAATRNRQFVHIDEGAGETPPSRSPAFLSRLKEFTWGE